MADYKRRDASGQHADFGIGRRYLRMVMRLMRTSQAYLPPRLRRAGWLLFDKLAFFTRQMEKSLIFMEVRGFLMLWAMGWIEGQIIFVIF